MKTLILATMISLTGLSPLCAAISIERVFEAEDSHAPFVIAVRAPRQPQDHS